MRLFTTLALSLLILTALAQAPQKMSYQAVVRNTSNDLVVNKAVGLRISIVTGTATGASIYVETQSPTTNANGLFAIEIGGGTVVSGSFAAVDWSHGPYFVKTEIDPAGGTAYSITGVSQLLSVPYALYAEKSGTPGPQGPAGAAGPAGPQGAAGVAGKGIASTINNGNGTYTFNFSDGSSFTTANLTGPQGAAGAAGAAGAIGATGSQGPIGVTGATGNGITTTLNNGNGTYTFNYSDGSSFTTADLTGPQGATGATGSAGSQGPVGSTGAAGTTGNGITSTVNNGNGTYTFSYSDGSTFTTADLTGPQGATGSTGAAGATGSPGAAGATGATGATGNGITSTVNNGNGTYTFNFSDASSFTTANLTGPTGATGAAGAAGATGATGAAGKGITSTVNNGNGTYTFNYSDGSSFTTANLTGPTGASGATGAAGAAGATGATGATGKGITSTVNNGNGTYTFNYSDASSFTTANLTGPQGATGATGAAGAPGAAGATGAAGAPGATGAQGPAGNPVDIAFRAYKTSVVSQNSLTKITFDAVAFNEGGGWNASTNTFTAPSSGVYQFTALLFPQSATSYSAVLRVNGVTTRLSYYPGAIYLQSSTFLIKLNAGDLVDLSFDAGVSMSFYGNSVSTYANSAFEGFKVN